MVQLKPTSARFTKFHNSFLSLKTSRFLLAKHVRTVNRLSSAKTVAKSAPGARESYASADPVYCRGIGIYRKILPRPSFRDAIPGGIGREILWPSFQTATTNSWGDATA